MDVKFLRKINKNLHNVKINRKFADADRTTGSPGLGLREVGVCKDAQRCILENILKAFIHANS